ncbi:MAG TPA: N,N-dimethylformamidase beta subunit family domain-containing protein [Polyangiaceae bacterium]|nr:N,N-dimethylformamidase beta subunit family domain-containing protein [Polyangiaceae bacterium]
MVSDTGDGGKPRVPRRLVLKSLATGAVLWEPACSAPPIEAPAVGTHQIVPPKLIETPIRIENRLPGTRDFSLQRPAYDRQVEGYASTTSASVGEMIAVAVNVSRSREVRWDLYRIGYYQGLGGRLVSSGDPVRVAPQPEPSISSVTGLIECAWATAFELTVDATWQSGYYLLKLTTDDGFESHVPFVIRESGRKAPLLMQANVTRWQAYNTWGGVSLYVNQLPAPKPFSGDRGYQVSFDRPYTVDLDEGALVEHSMVRWLEQQGYDVAYVTNVDIDSSPEVLEGRQLYMTAGHDEYWSLAERNALEAARDLGLSMAFFTGNTAFRRIRLEPSGAGIPRRTMTCYKSASLDPRHDAEDCTADFQRAPHARPENGMLGLLWSGWGHLQGFPFIVSAPDHWIYEGTGVKAGESLGNIVGYEWDAVSDNGSSPSGLEVVSSSPALHEFGYVSPHNATVFYPTPSSFVFSAGTIGWAKGLSDEGVLSVPVQQVTENILCRAGLFPEARAQRPSTPTYELGIPARSRVLAGGKRGHADGPVSRAQFDNPSGIAVGAEGEIYVCDTGNNSVRKISADGHVSTLIAKSGNNGIKLDTPTGIAVDANSNVYVSDTGCSRIVRIGPDGHAENYAGREHAEHYNDDPDRANARFRLQRGLSIAPSGLIYVADLRNDVIRCIDPATGAVSTAVTSANGPTAVAVDTDGTIYYLATYLGALIQVAPNGDRTVLVNERQIYGDRSGPAAQAALRAADGLILTRDGLVFTDTGNNRVRALVLEADNNVVTLFGNGHAGDPASGAETELSLPRAIAAVSDGYLVADTANHRIVHFSNDPAFFARQ